MKRSILLSLMAIGAAVALVVGGASFAAFTSTDTDTGDVTAGTVVITVVGDGPASIGFDPGDAGCPANLAPGDECDSGTITVTNTGSLPITLGTPSYAFSGDLATCDGGGLNFTTNDEVLSYTPNVTVIAPLGGTATINFDVALDDVGDDCQGDTGTIEVSVTATNS